MLSQTYLRDKRQFNKGNRSPPEPHRECQLFTPFYSSDNRKLTSVNQDVPLEVVTAPKGSEAVFTSKIFGNLDLKRTILFHYHHLGQQTASVRLSSSRRGCMPPAHPWLVNRDPLRCLQHEEFRDPLGKEVERVTSAVGRARWCVQPVKPPLGVTASHPEMLGIESPVDFQSRCLLLHTPGGSRANSGVSAATHIENPDGGRGFWLRPGLVLDLVSIGGVNQ